MLNFSNKPLETFIVNSYLANTCALIKPDGTTINGTSITGTYLKVVNNRSAVFTALQDCVISCVITKHDSTENQIFESLKLKTGEKISQALDGMMMVNVIST